jgi:hypothetical protein
MAVSGESVPLHLCVTLRLTSCRCLPCLLASQTALTPSANPLGKPRLHADVGEYHKPGVSRRSSEAARMARHDSKRTPARMEAAGVADAATSMSSCPARSGHRSSKSTPAAYSAAAGSLPWTSRASMDLPGCG